MRTGKVLVHLPDGSTSLNSYIYDEDIGMTLSNSAGVITMCMHNIPAHKPFIAKVLSGTIHISRSQYERRPGGAPVEDCAFYQSEQEALKEIESIKIEKGSEIKCQS